jgi:hypothetical protein
LSARATTRKTIHDLSDGISFEEMKARIPDAGRRRLLSFGMDFDTRALSLSQEINEKWEPAVQEMHRDNRERTRLGLIQQFGEHAIELKIENFIAIETKPMSVLAYHNAFYEQVRRAFVMADYYPALVGACALGERILNHLMIDMRGWFKDRPEYKHVYRKDSFADWDVAIDTLLAWEIMLEPAAEAFKKLKTIRNRSIHFNPETYSQLREDALAAILEMRTIIDQQFGTFAVRPWFIRGTKGHVFIRKEWEGHPFVRTYFVPNCPYVGPLFGMAHDGRGQWSAMDKSDYGDGKWTDEEFAREYNERDPDKVVSSAPSGFGEPN